MGRRIVRIGPELLMEIFAEGNVIGEDSIVRVIEGPPADATFVRAWYEGEWRPDGCIVLLLEHPSWPEQEEGALFDEITVIMSKELRLQGG